MFSSALNTSFTSPPPSFPSSSFNPRRPNSVSPRAVAAVEETARIATSNTSLYEVLRVEPTATVTEIKMAYRTLAKVYHPDLTPTTDDGRDFIQIHNAYETLSDPVARAVYDMSLGRRRTVANSCRGGFYPTRRWETDQCW